MKWTNNKNVFNGHLIDKIIAQRAESEKIPMAYTNKTLQRYDYLRGLLTRSNIVEVPTIIPFDTGEELVVPEEEKEEVVKEYMKAVHKVTLGEQPKVSKTSNIERIKAYVKKL